MGKKRKIIISAGAIVVLLVLLFVTGLFWIFQSLRNRMIDAFENASWTTSIEIDTSRILERVILDDGTIHDGPPGSLDLEQLNPDHVVTFDIVSMIWERNGKAGTFNSFDDSIRKEIEKLSLEWDAISEAEKIDRLKELRREFYLLVEHLNVRQFEEIRDEIEVMLNCLQILSKTNPSRVKILIESEKKVNQ